MTLLNAKPHHRRGPIIRFCGRGGGPGGIRSAIYLARHRRKVLLPDKVGGSEWHGRYTENLLTQPAISVAELMERVLAWARPFTVAVVRAAAIGVNKCPLAL